MYILAFETSCDDTSIAIFNGDELISMDTASQIKTHNKTGWVVPEVAAREHANSIFWVLENVLKSSDIKLENIDYITCTMTPGLIPSLLTGITVAKTLSNIYKVPFIEINHIEAHIFSNFLERKESDIKFPLVCLTVSWGHNEIYHMNDMWDYNRIGGTTDDAAGEAFDKVAKMMWLEYPGWPVISKLAEEYSPHPNPTPGHPSLEQSSIHLDLPTGDGINTFPPIGGKYPKGDGGLFPRVWLVKNKFDFSFSGLKSAVKREVDKRKNFNYDKGELEGELSDHDKKEIAFEFENAVCEVLAYKLINSAKILWVKTVMLAWGVSANNKLNKLIYDMSKKENFEFISPVKKVYSMDNAAMVGINTYYKIKKENI